MNLQTFDNTVFNTLRVICIDNEPFFIAKDIADTLNYRDGSTMIRIISPKHIIKLDKEQAKSLLDKNHPKGINLINEQGLYEAVFKSTREEAIAFREWITGDVIPSIRKHGAYMTDDTIKKALSSPDFLIELATKLKEEQKKNEYLQETIKIQQPSVDFHNKVSQSVNSLHIGTFSKILRQNGVPVGRNRFYDYLRDNGYLIRQKRDKYIPTQKAIEKGIFEITEDTVGNEEIGYILTTPLYITEKGQSYFFKLFHKTIKSFGKANY